MKQGYRLTRRPYQGLQYAPVPKEISLVVNVNVQGELIPALLQVGQISAAKNYAALAVEFPGGWVAPKGGRSNEHGLVSQRLSAFGLAPKLRKSPTQEGAFGVAHPY